MPKLNKLTKRALWITAALCAYLFGAMWLSVNISVWFATLILAPILFLITLYILAWVEIEREHNKPHKPNKT